jgi:hypothetical protein
VDAARRNAQSLIWAVVDAEFRGRRCTKIKVRRETEAAGWVGSLRRPGADQNDVGLVGKKRQPPTLGKF